MLWSGFVTLLLNSFGLLEQRHARLDVLWRNHEAVKMDSHSIAKIIKQKGCSFDQHCIHEIAVIKNLEASSSQASVVKRFSTHDSKFCCPEYNGMEKMATFFLPNFRLL